MAAPKGNNFWKLRSKHGRDKIFKDPDLFIKEAYKYFENCNKNPWYKNEVIKSGLNVGQIVKVPTQRPYTIKGLCIYLGITEKTFLNYEKDKNYKDFFQVFTHVREIIENNQLEGATVGAYNANIIGRLLGLSDKQEVDQKQVIEFKNVSKQFPDK